LNMRCVAASQPLRACYRSPEVIHTERLFLAAASRLDCGASSGTRHARSTLPAMLVSANSECLIAVYCVASLPSLVQMALHGALP
jgi:hypothetical protein